MKQPTLNIIKEEQAAKGTLANRNLENIYTSILDLIGNTPIVMMNRAFPGMRVFGKLEFFNPSNSIKDRTALYLISQAEEKGLLKKGGTIIESSSGNFGLALSYIGLMKNYRVICVVDPRIQDFFLRMYKLLNAEIVMVDRIEKGSYQNSRISMAKKLNAEIENSYRPDQYDNCDNREAHYIFTGTEIIDQMKGIGIDYLVVGVSTGGTISGCGKKVKEAFPNCKVVAVDAVGSALFGNKSKKRFMTGLGSNYIPKNLIYELCDEVILVDDNKAFAMTRYLLKTEFIFVGPSSGAVAYAIRKILDRDSNRTPVIAAIFPDNGYRYMDTAFNDVWYKLNIEDKAKNE